MPGRKSKQRRSHEIADLEIVGVAESGLVTFMLPGGIPFAANLSPELAPYYRRMIASNANS